MAPGPNKIIIDTDPGVDDVLALLLALSAGSDELEVLLISVSYGNVEVWNCLRNVVSMFHVIEKEMQWRKNNNLPEGFGAMRNTKPIVAVGADKPLGDQTMLADYFHGIDGLGGIHETHPHHTSPEETWKHLFDRPPHDTLLTSAAVATTHAQPKLPPALFTPSVTESHLEILRLLLQHPPDTITIIAIGPLTNLALAAAENPTAFLRAKAVLVMGGAIFCPGNITPVGEFNALADAYAAARVFALTSPDPASTMPPVPPPIVSVDGGIISPPRPLAPYPSKHTLGDRRLNLILFPLDLTTHHTLRRDEFVATTSDLVKGGSPLAEWTTAFLSSTFQTMESLYEGHEEDGMGTYTSLHDPACIWYAMSVDEREGESSNNDTTHHRNPTQPPTTTTTPTIKQPQPQPQPQKWTLTPPEDIRIETQGQWTRGMCVIDRRDRKMLPDDHDEHTEGEIVDVDANMDANVDGKRNVKVKIQTDRGGWLSPRKGNRVKRCVGTPGERVLARVLLEGIFGGVGGEMGDEGWGGIIGKEGKEGKEGGEGWGMADVGWGMGGKRGLMKIVREGKERKGKKERGGD